VARHSAIGPGPDHRLTASVRRGGGSDLIEGGGHELHERDWGQILDALVTHTAVRPGNVRRA
jgi:hypothetical protein